MVDTNRGLLQIREFIGSLIVVYSPIDHARVMSMKVKIVIIFILALSRKGKQFKPFRRRAKDMIISLALL